ncbi:MAG: tRNA adenosine(34) deaminase TadA [Anaeroplasma sp.]
MKKNKDEYYMSLAIKEALKSKEINEVPVGCIIVKEDKIISRGHNKRETLHSSLAHAEILAIKKACNKMNDWRLEGCTMYITLEPCVMCSGAIIQSRIPNVVYGARDYRFGTHVSKINLFDVKFNHYVNIYGGILEKECSDLLTSFFSDLRKKS